MLEESPDDEGVEGDGEADDDAPAEHGGGVHFVFAAELGGVARWTGIVTAIERPLADGAGHEELGIEGFDAEIGGERFEALAIIETDDAGLDAVVYGLSVFGGDVLAVLAHRAAQHWPAIGEDIACDTQHRRLSTECRICPDGIHVTLNDSVRPARVPPTALSARSELTTASGRFGLPTAAMKAIVATCLESAARKVGVPATATLMRSLTNAQDGQFVLMNPRTNERTGIRRYLPRTRRGWAATILGTLTLVAVAAFLLTRVTPWWHHPLDATQDDVIQVADDAHRRVIDLHNTLQRSMGGENTWTITDDHVNALLAVKFAEKAGPQAHAAGVSAPSVYFGDGQITVSARTTKLPGGPAEGTVVSVAFSISTETDMNGMAWGRFQLDGLWVGALRMPKAVAEKRIEEMLPEVMPAIHQAITLQLGARNARDVGPEVERAISATLKGEEFPLRFKVNRRTVAIREITVQDRTLAITFVPIQEAGRP